MKIISVQQYPRIVSWGATNAVFVLASGKLCGAAENITVTAPRPINEVIKQLRAKYGCRLTFEEVPFENTEDLQDYTSPIYKLQNPGAALLVASRTATLSFSFDPPTLPASDADQRALVDKLVQTHEKSGNPGRYQAYHSSGVSHVFPAAVKRANGAVLPIGSIMDTKISFPAADRRLGEIINLVVGLLNEAGTSVVLGWVSPNLMQTSLRRANMGADNISARDALLEAFKLSNIHTGDPDDLRLTWTLLYERGTYFFNIEDTPKMGR